MKYWNFYAKQVFDKIDFNFGGNLKITIDRYITFLPNIYITICIHHTIFQNIFTLFKLIIYIRDFRFLLVFILK